MADRSTETSVTFVHPFLLPSIGDVLPAGTYRVVADDVEIPGLSFVAYARASTQLHVPAIGNPGARHEVYSIGHDELDAALTTDKHQ